MGERKPTIHCYVIYTTLRSPLCFKDQEEHKTAIYPFNTTFCVGKVLKYVDAPGELLAFDHDGDERSWEPPHGRVVLLRMLEHIWSLWCQSGERRQ